MSQHVTEVVKQEQHSDESVAVTIRCCDDPKTDSTLTIYGVAKHSAETIAEAIDKHHNKVAAKHQGMQAGKQHLLTVQKTKAHEV
jgi:hypothetical protein